MSSFTPALTVKVNRHSSETAVSNLHHFSKQLQLIALLFVMALPLKSLAQVPTISYSSPEAYTQGTAIAALAPTSSGVAPFGYNNTPVSIGSGFSSPEGVAVDAAGNVYVADKANNAVKKIPVGGGAPVIIGSGFSSPVAVAVDAFGNVYVADGGSNSVKEIPVGGDAPVTLASGFSELTGVAVDAAGNVYVVDYAASMVMEIPAGGGVPFAIGSGFNFPYGVAVDPIGNVYVADEGNNAVKKIPVGGGAPVTIGSGFSFPFSVAIDQMGNVDVADYGNTAVKQIPVGGGAPVVLSNAFSSPYGVAADGAGNVCVADAGNTAVQEVIRFGGYTIDAPLPAGLRFSYSTGAISGTPIVVSPATTYTATAYNTIGSKSAALKISVNAAPLPTISYGSPKTYTQGKAITELSPTRTNVAAFGYNNSPVTVGSGFNAPQGVAIDAAGNMYVADEGNNAVKKIPVGGGAPVGIGSGFSSPVGVAVDAKGNVYVADKGNNAVKKIQVGGGATVTMASGLSQPTGVAVDAAGNVYVANYGVSMVMEIPADGGTSFAIGSGFSFPYGVAVDAVGNVYVADEGNNAIKQIPVGGGSPVTLGSGFSSPIGVAVDGAGNVDVVEYGNNAVKQIPAGGGAPVVLSHAFINTAAVASDGVSNLYVALASNNTIEELQRHGGYAISPELPAGLAFDYITGNISGIPIVASPATTYTVTAYNSFGGSQSATLSVAVNAAVLPTISYSSPKTYTLGTAIPAFEPISTNVAAAGHSNSPVTIDSQISDILAVAIDASAGFAYVAQAGNSTIKKIPVQGGAPVSIGSGFSNPSGVAVDAAGNVYVADAGNGAVKKIPASGGSPVALVSGFTSTAVAVDAAGNVYAGDNDDGVIKKIPVGGGTPSTLGSGFSSGIIGVAVDPASNVYVSDAYNHALKEIPAGGGSPVTILSGFTPTGVAIDAAGDIYVGDKENKSLIQIPAGGGSPVTLYNGFNLPEGVAVDGAGNIFVADAGDNLVEEIKPSGGFYISPFLPAGLNFNNSTGAISGTPIAVSPATTYTVTAYNSFGGSKSATLSIAVGVLRFAAIPSKPYGTANFNPGAKSTYAITYTSSNTAVATIVSGKIHTTGVGTSTITAKDGYTTLTQLLTVTPVPLTITASNQSNVYGAAIPSPTASYSGLVNGDTPASLTTQPTIATTATATSPVGTYPITANGAVDVNYTISYAAGSLAITPAPLTITADNQTRVYGAANPALTAKFSGFVNGDTQASLTTQPTVSTTATTASAAGTYAITACCAADANYTISYTAGILNVLSTNATLSALAISSGTLTPAFATNTVSYTASVTNATTSISLTPAASDPTATITVNGKAVASGTASASMALGVGSNTITTVVTAQDGTTTKTYKITVTRAESTNATLSKLGPGIGGLTPAFSSGTTSYTISTGNANASMTLTPISADANATIKVNGTVVTSGTVTAQIALAEGGQTVISTVVTAQDGTTTKTYTLRVTRAPSTNATLSNLQPGNGTLSQAFASGTTSYTDSVDNAVSTITITPTATDANATIKVNGAAITSGTASGAIALAEGAKTVITTVVTAQNGTATKTYTVTVTRAPSTNAGLSKLGPNIGGLTPAFSSTTTSYTISTANATASMKLTPVSNDANATIKVNGTTVTSGTVFGPIALAPGPNNITTVVTAQDGTTTKTYTLTVTRAASGADSYDPGISVTKPAETPALADGGIQVHQGVSPNGDGINDFLQIDNIGQYPANKLAIINRNGQLIYETSGYDNSSKVFDGHSNKNGQMQLPGTYFYQLDYTVNGTIKHKTGFIVLKY